ncbi:MAG: superoxide dismutase [Candidatus Scalindua sp. AMX11]|nr:MAG: superoxide dismutase [Candidatus Scalindua sp.]NOG84688.1 superoxide dismutase [Planctomycetota bacterium]RZV98302.1 MAG: superoxide dismutase [Candidatus Scalindua sp. SCAELEC01]TDE66606.1 MAG: superoxide dismutase [Candidatus Scalindua sp. AMX11]GJQ58982.1 MAG: superoxide dismutase [Candidatus Scalindua sp.]
MITIPELPFTKDALEPYISSKTLDFHYGKHHNAYVANTNKLLENHVLRDKTLEEIIESTAGDSSQVGLFNNAAQVWNHTFYWNSIKPKGGGKPTGKVADRINDDLGGYDKFVEAFQTAGAGQFGSGWAWLVENKDGKLEVTKTANADTPLAHGLKPVLTMDVWEHAYYLDYQNRRPDYMKGFIENLINWDFANSNI